MGAWAGALSSSEAQTPENKRERKRGVASMSIGPTSRPPTGSDTSCARPHIAHLYQACLLEVPLSAWVWAIADPHLLQCIILLPCPKELGLNDWRDTISWGSEECKFGE